MRSRTTILSILTPLLAAALLAACGGHPEAREATVPDPVEARLARARQVEVAEAVELPGSVEADRTTAVSSRVMATVTAVHVKLGATVRKGQPLVEIDPQTARGQVGQAQGALAQAQAGLALAERNYERFKNLNAANAASDLELDMARTQYEQAKGAVEQARGAVSSASSVASESRVSAPFAGRVAAVMVAEGDLAAPGRPLVRIESSEAHLLAVSVPESQLAKIRPQVGDGVPVAVDSRPELGRFQGTIAEISPSADPMAHAFQVKISLGDREVPAGSFGRAWFTTGSRRTVSIPENAVLHQGGTSLVVVRDQEGRALSRVVTLGAPLDGGRVEVLSGLSGGETVLVGLAAVPPLGAPVRESAAPAGEEAS
jgi:RND family efflux transporter MFP subunit